MDFAKGISIGFAMASVVVLGLLAIELRDFGAIYADFGRLTLPVLTRITLSTAWLFGAPLGGAAACAGLLRWRPRSLVPYVLVATVLGLAVVMTWFGPRLPVFELAGNIKGE